MENTGVEDKTVTLDYAPLTAPVTDIDRKEFIAASSNSTGNSISKDTYTRVMATIAAIFVLFVIIVFIANGEIGTLFTVVFWFSLMLGGIGWAIKKGLKAEQTRQVKLSRFAKSNGLVYVSGKQHPVSVGMIFNKGHSRELEDQLIFPDGLEICNYKYVTGSGKNRSTHTYGYVKIKLERKLPHMVLDAKQNNFWAFSNLPETFNKSQSMSMEGDFDTYYTLYAPNEYKRDALYVFTPDVMAALIDSGAKYDMEVIDDNLFIYHTVHFDLTSQSQLEGILKITHAIGRELKDQTEYYSDERVSDRAKNMIAPQGTRLKKGVNFVVVGISLLFFANFILGAIWPEYVFVANIVIGFVFWGFVFYAIVKSVKQRR